MDLCLFFAVCMISSLQNYKIFFNYYPEDWFIDLSFSNMSSMIWFLLLILKVLISTHIYYITLVSQLLAKKMIKKSEQQKNYKCHLLRNKVTNFPFAWSNQDLNCIK